jgi:hypothetical protein
MNKQNYLIEREAFIAQHNRPQLLQPIAQTVVWLQEKISGHSIYCGASFGGSFCQRHNAGFDIWIDIQDVAYGIAQGAGTYAGILEAIALHEVAHIGGADEAGAWQRAKTIRCKLPRPIASAREMQNAESFYLASHALGRAPRPGEWVRLELPPTPSAKPQQQAQRRLPMVVPMAGWGRVVRQGGM